VWVSSLNVHRTIDVAIAPGGAESSSGVRRLRTAGCLVANLRVCNVAGRLRSRAPWTACRPSGVLTNSAPRRPLSAYWSPFFPELCPKTWTISMPSSFPWCAAVAKWFEKQSRAGACVRA
jgi:hypothetical protein